VSRKHDEIVAQEIAGCQDRLIAYILTLVPQRDTAYDIRQEVNLVLWRRRGDFTLGTSFVAWAVKVAFFQILAYRRDRGRARHLFFSEELMVQLAGEAQEDVRVFDARRGALKKCLAKLTEKQRWLIEQRYHSEKSVKVLAEVMDQSAGAVATAVYRVRNALRRCVVRSLGSEAVS